MGRYALGFLFAYLLCGCQSMPSPREPGKIYRRDMVVTVNGKKGVGTLVVPRALSYKIEVDSRGELDAFTLTSCGRDHLIQDIKGTGIFGRKRKVSIDYAPMPGLEDDGFCQLDLGGYDKGNGRHSWALVDFEYPDYTLPATLYCNGEIFSATGVSICQSRAGLFQRIEFASEIEVFSETGCEIGEQESKRALFFPIKKDVCYYAIRETAGSSRVHRLTTVGYEDIIVTGEED